MSAEDNCLLRFTRKLVPPSEQSTNFMDDSVLTDMECKEVSLLYIKSNARRWFTVQKRQRQGSLLYVKPKIVYCT